LEKGDIIRGDALFMSDLFSENEYFTRAIIPTAYGMDKALLKTAPLVKKGGIIHFYTFKTKEETNGLIRSFEREGLKTISFRRCGNIAPGVYRFVFDLVKEK
jgi:tRNA (guanine37-N1)-methyltransferase